MKGLFFCPGGLEGCFSDPSHRQGSAAGLDSHHGLGFPPPCAAHILRRYLEGDEKPHRGFLNLLILCKSFI